MRKLLLIILFLPLFASARKFYFSSSGGSDSYSTTQAQNSATPWKTLIKLQSLVTLGNTTFLPGDTIAFKRGDDFNNGYDGASAGQTSFKYVSCSWQYYPIEGYTAPSGTKANPIVFTNYGDPALPLPNFYFPTASSPQYGNPIEHNVLEFVGVDWIVIDGLKFADPGFPIQDKANPAYTRSSLILGTYQTGDNQRLPSLRAKMNSHCVVKNCYFANSSFGFHEVYCDTCEIGNNTFENFKSTIDTTGVHDVAAAAIDGLQGYYLNIHHNIIKGSWAKSGRVSSTQGLVGVGINAFIFQHSRIAYNTFIDNRHVIEIGNLDQTNINNGAQYDTIAYNKIIGGSPNIAYLQGISGPFAGAIHNLCLYNNTIIENQSSRHSGYNFGYDRDGNGESFNQFWFFKNKFRNTNYVAQTGSIPFGSHTMTMASVAGIYVGSRVYAPEGVPIFRVDPINQLNPAPQIPKVLSIVGNIVTIDSTALQAASGISFTFYPPLDSLGINWSQPPNVSNSGNGSSWDNPNDNARPIQYQEGGLFDTVVESKNNVFYYTNGTQMLYDNASHPSFKHSNNIYYIKGNFTYQTSSGATINNVTRLGSGATLGTNERIFTTKFFKDTSAALPENWDLRMDSATGFAATGGSAIQGFPTDFAGNLVTGIRTMGIYQAPVVGRKFYVSSSGGNDANNGTSPATPWKTLAYVEDLANTIPTSFFMAGDTIAFKRGDIFDNGRNRAFGSFIWTGPGTSGWGGNCPSGTALNPIVFTSYGIGEMANIVFPFPSTVASQVKTAMLFDHVGYITFDSLQFNDIRFPYTEKIASAYTCTALYLGEGKAAYTNLSVHDIVVKNCNFSRVCYGIMSTGNNITIENNSFTNFKSGGDTTGMGDVGADALMPTGSRYLIKNNLIQGSWAYSGMAIPSSSEGKLGGGLESINDFDSSLVIYNTFFDNSGSMEFGANAGINYGPNDDTFAYNKFINNYNLCYVNVSGQFNCTAKNMHFWNNVIIENNNSRHSGSRFGQDVLGDGQSFLNWYYWPTYPLNASLNTAGRYAGYYSDAGVVADTLYDIRNNIFWNTTGQIMNYTGRTKVKYRNNVYRMGGTSTVGNALQGGEISTNNKIFLDTSNVNPIFWNVHLANGSPAINAGMQLGGVTKDWDGNAIGNPPSMGIFEYTAAAVLPSVTTLAATSISYTTALIGGNITSDGGAPILRSGLMYSTIPLGTDTLSGVKVINSVLGTGVYTSPITGLTSSTTYYVRAFAVNNIGITWGANVSFITLTPPTLATVITSPATSITISAATLGGNVTLDGGASVTRRGVVYSTSVISDTNSITGGGRLASGTGTGIYTIPVTGLAINTLYHVRAFVVNSVGVYLAPEVTFTTLNIPTLTTLAATSITSNTASSGGNITSDGGSPVIRRGIVWNVFPISDTGTNPISIDANGGIGTFNLSVPTPVFRTYYVLAFAVNANGVAYGNLIQFQSLLAALPSVAWAGVNLGVVTSVVNGNVASEGSAPVTRRGFIYSLTTPLPADTNSGIKVIATGGGLGAFQATLTGLTALTTYYIRPFAVNAVGVSFDAETSFRTQGASSVTTTPPTAITATSATTGGVITDYGSTFVTRRQLIYSTSPIVDTNSTVGGGTLRYIPNITAYPILLTSLLPNTTYYIAAFVVNALDILTIGNQLSFTTLQLLSIPTVTTNAVTSITPTSANVGGNVTSDGNSAVTRRGILYSTSPLGDTTTGTKVISGTAGTGSYTIPLSSLTSSTIYFARAFAVNAIGISYGDNVQFVTSPALSFPTISTNVATAIGVTTATSGGNVVNDGNTTVFRRGLIYSTSPITDTNSVTGGGRIISGTTGTGTYTSSLTGLTGGTLYYIAAFAVNSVGVSIGNQRTFTTLPTPTAPFVTTLPATFITISTAVIGGNVTSDGNATVTRKGLVYSTVSPISDTNSVVGGKLIISGSGLGTFNASLSSLTSNTTYYVKAFALNSVGITYGDEVTFATPVYTPRFSNFRVRKKYIQKP